MRAPPLAPADMAPDRRALHDDMAAVVAKHLKGFVSKRPDGALVGPFPPLLRFPQFGGPAWDFTKALIHHSTLPKPAHEIAILATGAAFNSRYELYAHERVADAAGLSSAKIAAVAAGQRPADLTEEEAAAHDVAAALCAGRQLPESTYRRAVAAFGEDGTAELVYLVGGYCLVSVLLNAFDMSVPGREEDLPPDGRAERATGVALTLYDHPLSSYAQKVKIALREKGIPFATELPDGFGTGRRDGPFAAASPRGEVPALLDGDLRIFDSTIILEYVEERWPEPPLLPPDPAGRARARMVEDVCDSQYEAINWGFGEILWFRRATGALADEMRATAAGQTRVLQGWLAARLGDAPWFGGERFGWADAAAAPMVNRSVHYGLGPEPGGALAVWHARLRERPSVAATFAEFDAAAACMAAASDLYTSGGRRRLYRDHRLDWMIRSGGLEVVQAGLRDGNIRFSWPDPED